MVGHTDEITDFTLLTANNFILSSSLDKTVRRFDYMTGALLKTITFGDKVFAIDMIPGETNILVAVRSSNILKTEIYTES